MQLVKGLTQRLLTGGYLASTDHRNRAALISLRKRMQHYYRRVEYHQQWIKGINSNWLPNAHAAQIEMCKLIPQESSILEIGCGDGSAAAEIEARCSDVTYVGADVNPQLSNGRPFVACSADQLPFRSGCFDA